LNSFYLYVQEILLMFYKALTIYYI